MSADTQNVSPLSDAMDIDASNTQNNKSNNTIMNGSQSSHEAISVSKKERIRKIGYDCNGELMSGFEDVNDDELAFSSESDFAIFIKQISSEIPLQRLVAVKRMIKSCHLWGVEAVLSVLPRVKQLSCDKEMVIRQAIAEVLGPFAKYLVQYNEQNDLEGQQRTYNVMICELLPLIKEMLKDAMEVRQGAGSSLIIIAELLNKEQVYEHILKIVLHMAHDDSDDQKITALPLLGDLAPIVGSAVCKNYLSADLHALSQDNSFRVRKATVQYFGPICQQLSCTDCSECLLPIFLSLCGDSIWSVRKGCVESFVDVSSSIGLAQRIQLIPIMEKFLNDSSRWVRNTAYEILGAFLATLDSDSISADFLKYFTSIPHLSSAEADADCSNHCAFNLPAVALTIGKERWSELQDTYNILCRKTFKSRKTLACSIHEIALILGPQLASKYLLNCIEFFLKDIDDIRQGIIDNLWKILSIFNEKLKIEYISVLWELASESDVNWRFRLLLAKQLDEILYLYTFDGNKIIIQQLIPLIFQLCQDRMADVRYAAVYPIADAINILHKASDSLLCITEKLKNIYNGRTYSKRLLYIRIAQSCFDRLDRALFDELFLRDLLQYAQDKIFNVRYCLARFLAQHLLDSEDEAVRDAMEILKADEEDIEIKRFFMNEYEIEHWLAFKRAERKMKESVNMNGSEKMNEHKLGNKDLDSTDSSLYSSSDSEDLEDANDDSLNEDDLDDEEDDSEEDSTDAKLKSVSAELLAMDSNLNNNKLSNMDISVIGTNKLTEEEQEEVGNENSNTLDFLQHQDTPYKLEIAPELKEDDVIDTNTGNYGLPSPVNVVVVEESENNNKQESIADATDT